MPQNTTYSLGDLISSLINGLANPIIALLVGVAILVFFFGIVRYMYNVSNEKDLKKDRNFILWGILAIFVMVAIWGIVGFLQRTFFGTIAPMSAPNFFAPQSQPQNQNLQGSFPEDTPNFPDTSNA